MTITSEQIAEWRRRIRAFEMPAWSEEEYFILTLLAAYEQQAALLAEAREVVEAVTWIVGGAFGNEICPWCYSARPFGHAPDCQRQAILAKLGQP